MRPIITQRRAGQAIIGLLIAMAILVAVGAAMMGKFGGVYQTSIDKTNITVCGEYTSQIRQAISMYKQDNEGKNPPSLAALSKYGVINEMFNSPGCVYGYDPTSGEVTPPNSRPGAPPAAPSTQTGSGATPAPAASPNAAPAPSTGPRGPGGLPSTTVSGPGGMPIRVPTGGGTVDVNGGN
ncbi:MAG TPA: type II secretion system protein [Capsulimonadaceae bacterium]|jgi:type II secretory pathway pseudopilin PulG